jgi:hypothetical protein
MRSLFPTVVEPMDLGWLFPCLNGPKYHSWVDLMVALLCSKALWMYLARLLRVEDDDNYDLICLMKDESLVLISLMLSMISFIIPNITKVRRKSEIPSNVFLEW